MMSITQTYVIAANIIYGIEVDVKVSLLDQFIIDGIDTIYSITDKRLLLKILNPKAKKVIVGVKVCPETDVPGCIPMEALLYSSLDYEYIVQDIIAQNDKLKVLFIDSTPVYWILYDDNYIRLY